MVNKKNRIQSSFTTFGMNPLASCLRRTSTVGYWLTGHVNPLTDLCFTAQARCAGAIVVLLEDAAGRCLHQPHAPLRRTVVH